MFFKFSFIILLCLAINISPCLSYEDPLSDMDTDTASSTSSTSTVSENTSSSNSDSSSTEPQKKIGNVSTPSDKPPCWYLNMRKGPSIRFEVIKIFKGGTPLFIIGKDASSGWYNVNDGVVSGWCSGQYIKAGDDVPAVSANTPVVAGNNSSNTSSGSSSGTSGSSNGSSGTPAPKDSTGTLGNGSLRASDFGYKDPKYQAVFDIVQKFCDSNEAYKVGAGHTWKEGYASVTDCSGFTGSFYQKMAALSGIPPVFPKNSWYQSSTLYKNNYTDCISTKFPPPNPRDLIKPGDIFVMNKGAKYGHVGVFMGYDKSGNPVIAHSTPSTKRQNIYGKQGKTGVRIEVLPRSYQERWAGIYRIKKTDQMLDKLSNKS